MKPSGCQSPRNSYRTVPPPLHMNVNRRCIVLDPDCSARILHFAFREIDSQIMIVLRFRGSEKCHSCVFDFSVSSPYLIRSGRPSRIQWTHQPIRNENSEFTREFCMVTHFGFQKSRHAEFSRPVIVIPRQHTRRRGRARRPRAPTC